MPLLYLPSVAYVLGNQYWATQSHQAGVTPTPVGVGQDSSNNSYTLFSASGLGVLTKRDVQGVMQWQKSITGSNSVSGQAIVVDKVNGFVYVASISNTPSTINTTSGYPTSIFKYDLNGNVVWKVVVGSGAYDSSARMTVDSTGSPVLLLRTQVTAGGGYAVVVKLNKDTGAITWQRQLQNISQILGNISTDSANNVYITTTLLTISTATAVLLTKLNSSGTFQASKRLYDPLGQSSGAPYMSMEGGDIEVSPAGDVYVLVRNWRTDFAIQALVLFKLNASLVMQWQRSLQLTQGSVAFLSGSATLDTLGNLWTSWSRNNIYVTSQTNVVISKISSGGALLLSMTLAGSLTAGEGLYNLDICMDSLNQPMVYTQEKVLGAVKSTLARLPPTFSSLRTPSGDIKLESTSGTYVTNIDTSALVGVYTSSIAAGALLQATSTLSTQNWAVAQLTTQLMLPV